MLNLARKSAVRVQKTKSFCLFFYLIWPEPVESDVVCLNIRERQSNVAKSICHMVYKGLKFGVFLQYRYPHRRKKLRYLNLHLAKGVDLKWIARPVEALFRQVLQVGAPCFRHYHLSDDEVTYII